MAERAVVLTREQAVDVVDRGADATLGRRHADRERVLLPDVTHVEADLTSRVGARIVRARDEGLEEVAENAVQVGNRLAVEARDSRQRSGLRQVCTDQAPRR